MAPTTFLPRDQTEAVTANTVVALKSGDTVSLVSFNQFQADELNSYYGI